MVNLPMVPKSIILLILYIPTSLSMNNAAIPGIVGGTKCTVKEYPYYVTVSGSSNCGGVLITFAWVLTAAHCITPVARQKDILMVRAGYDGDRNSTMVQYRNVTHIHPHPSYDENEKGKEYEEVRFDIGLLHLSSPFEISSVVDIVTLPTKGYTENCKQGLVMGTGLMEMVKYRIFEFGFDNGLFCVLLTIVSKEVCASSWGSFLDDHIICTMEKRAVKDACKGDSGGPVICNHTLIGIISRGKGCADPRYSNLHIKVESFLDFIQDTIYGSDDGVGVLATYPASGCLKSGRFGGLILISVAFISKFK